MSEDKADFSEAMEQHRRETTTKNEAKKEESTDNVFKLNTADELLSFCSLCVMVVGVTVGVVMLVNAENSSSSTLMYISSVVIIISSVLQWAFAKVFVNISNTLAEINSKLKNNR